MTPDPALEALDELLEDLSFTQAALAVDPDAADQVPRLAERAAECEAERRAFAEATRLELAARALSKTRDAELDDAILAFSRSLRDATREEGDARFLRYFKHSPAELVELGRLVEASTVQSWLPWIALEPEAEVAAHEEPLAVAAAASLEALEAGDRRAGDRLAQVVDHVEPVCARARAELESLRGELARRAADRARPATWPERFFRAPGEEHHDRSLFDVGRPLEQPAEPRPLPALEERPPMRASGLWARWVGAVALGELLGVSFGGFVAVWTMRAFGPPGGATETASVVFGMLVARAAEGAVLGGAQAMVLRRAVPSLSTKHWVLATMCAELGAWLVGVAVSSLAPPAALSPLATFGVVIAAGAVLGGALGIGQALVLGPRTGHAGLWVLTNVAGWSLAIAVSFLIAARFAPAPPAWVAFLGGLGGLLTGAIAGAVTGLALLTLANAWPPRARLQALLHRHA